MEESNQFFNGDEVISIRNPDDNVLLGHHTYKAEEFLNRLVVNGVNKVTIIEV